MIPESTGTTAVATNPGYAKLFTQLGLGNLAVGIALVVLIDKPEGQDVFAPVAFRSAMQQADSGLSYGRVVC